MHFGAVCEKGTKRGLEISGEVEDTHSQLSPLVSAKGKVGEQKHVGKDLRQKKQREYSVGLLLCSLPSTERRFNILFSPTTERDFTVMAS